MKMTEPSQKSDQASSQDSKIKMPWKNPEYLFSPFFLNFAKFFSSVSWKCDVDIQLVSKTTKFLLPNYSAKGWAIEHDFAISRTESMGKNVLSGTNPEKN